MSVINTPQPIHEQIFAFAQHLGCPDDQIPEEMNKFFSLKVRKQRTKKAKAPKVDMPQCCARVWDHKNEDGTVVPGIGGCCSKASTGETFEFNGQTFHFCKRHGAHFNNNPELAVNPRFARTEVHGIKSQAKATKLGFEDWKPVLWLGVAKDSTGAEIERPLPSDCVGEFSDQPLRWRDMKHSRKARKTSKKPKKQNKKEVEQLTDAIEALNIDNKETTKDVKETTEETVEEVKEDKETTQDNIELDTIEEADESSDSSEEEDEDEDDATELEAFTDKESGNTFYVDLKTLKVYNHVNGEFEEVGTINPKKQGVKPYIKDEKLRKGTLQLNKEEDSSSDSDSDDE